MLASLEGFQPTFTGQLDALLFGITEAAVETVFGDFSAISLVTGSLLPHDGNLRAGDRFITDRMIEPRLGSFDSLQAPNVKDDSAEPLSELERKGLAYAGWATLFVIALDLFYIGARHTSSMNPLRGSSNDPFYQSLVAAFFCCSSSRDGPMAKVPGVLAITVTS